MIKLGKIHIENFKSFIEPIEFDFSNKDLVLFDGPNGFGKTTVFDAVELCFTGKISRIAKKMDDKVKKDHILKGDNTKPTIIKLELLQNNECIKVIGISIKADLSGENLMTANYSNSLERFETEMWEGSSKKKLDIKKLKEFLNNIRLDSTFALFNYIQQEETCHFLKLKEKERHNQISHLFGTTEEKDKFKKLEAIIQEIKYKIQEKNNSINRKKHELSELSKPANESNNIEPSLPSGKIALFSDLSSSTREQLEAYGNNLEGLRWIVTNQTEYKKLHFNFLLEKITTEQTTQLENYIKVGVAEKYREIQKLKKQYTRWKCSKEKEKKYQKLIQIYDGSPNSLNKNTLNKYQAQFPNQFESYTANINSFNTLIDSNDSLDSLLNKIYEGRKNLLTHYEGHLGKDSVENLSDIHCPFCGDQKEHWQNLLDQYESQSVRFEEQLGRNVKQLNRITEKLIKELINPLVLKMRRFSLRYRSYLGYDFNEVIKVKNIEQIDDDAKELIKAKIFDETDFDSMIKVKNWLDSNVVKCETFQDEHLRKISKNYSEKLRLLIDHINDQKKTIHVDIPKDFQSLNSDLRSLNLNFDKGVLHSPININDIDKDAMLLSRLIIQKNSGSYNAKQQELNDLQHKLAKLESKKQQITQIKNIYNKEIKAYEKNVAKHIAIPLFVYSSKILQSRPEGSGVYLITPENSGLKGFVRFSATNTDSHDAWNTMSSGQLAGVVISFMLAMNKVYPSKLSALMIDDPVQTMDEVNMASFVQLMRYEFPNLQILLSTHENKVANYFNYKYKEAGLETYPINMKDERLGFVDS